MSWWKDELAHEMGYTICSMTNQYELCDGECTDCQYFKDFMEELKERERMDNLSYRPTNKYIYFFWNGEYCGSYDIQSKDLFLLWKDRDMNKAVNDKLKELDNEDIK